MNHHDFFTFRLDLFSLFADYFTLPSPEAVFALIDSNISKSVFPAYGIIGLLDIIDGFSEHQNSIQVLSAHSILGSFMLDYPEVNIYEEDKCLKFFKHLLCEEMVPSPKQISILIDDFKTIVQYEEFREVQISNVFKLFSKIRNYCDTVKDFVIHKSLDDNPCDCYEYAVSGDCYHLD